MQDSGIKLPRKVSYYQREKYYNNLAPIDYKYEYPVDDAGRAQIREAAVKDINNLTDFIAEEGTKSTQSILLEADIIGGDIYFLRVDNLEDIQVRMHYNELLITVKELPLFDLARQRAANAGLAMLCRNLDPYAQVYYHKFVRAEVEQQARDLKNTVFGMNDTCKINKVEEHIMKQRWILASDRASRFPLTDRRQL